MQNQTRTPTLTRRLRAASRSAWWGSRARNVLTRKRRLAVLFAPLFALVFGALIALPNGARQLWASLKAVEIAVRDTEPLWRDQLEARINFGAADSNLADARGRYVAAQAESSLVMTVTRSPRVDSLRAALRALDALIARASDAPLPETYRAIAESPAMKGDPRARALLDSLSDIERERDEFGAGAAVDPVFVSLTTRANALGRAIVATAGEAREGLKRDLSTAERNRPVPIVAAVTLPDTAVAAARRDSARAHFVSTTRSLAEARLANLAARSAANEARKATQLAPVSVLLVGSAVLTAVLLFALSLGEEVRAPRVADHDEAEHVADTRVLSVVGTRAIPEQRMRRAADRQRPALLDPQLDAYRMLAWHISANPPRDGLLVVTGDDALITSVIAANIAAVLANEARAVLLLDIDFERSPISDVLHIPIAPGISSVLENRRRWSETVVQVTSGRGRTLDCIPAGVRTRALGPAEREALRTEIQRAGRRYDLTVVSSPPDLAQGALLGIDALVCATLSRTKLATLSKTVRSLRGENARVLGVALWEGTSVRLRHGLGRRRPRSSWAKRGSDEA